VAFKQPSQGFEFSFDRYEENPEFEGGLEEVVQSEPLHPRPPWQVWLVGGAGLFLALAQGCRGALWVGLYATWQEVPLAVSPFVLAGLSFLWAGVFGIWAWGWWRRRRWAWRVFPGVVMAYVVYQWWDRWFLSVSPLVHRDTVYMLVRSLLVVLAMLYLWKHPDIRRHFGVGQ